MAETTRRPALPTLAAALLFACMLLWPAAGIGGRNGSPKAADLVRDGQPFDLDSAPFTALFAELRQRHGFGQDELDALFDGLTVSRRVLELMDHQWEAKPYYQYAPRLVTQRKIARGRRLLEEHRDLLARIEQRFGVDRQYVVAIWGIETRYGKHQGGFQVLRSLTTLFAAYPRRSAFFRRQLIEFLVLCRDNQVDPREVRGSFAGAFGQTQFIPSSFRAYGVDFDQDGRVDVWRSVPDVLASIANYLKQFHWTFQAPVYVELGHELKDRRLLAAYHQGRRAKLPWREVARLQGVDLPPAPGSGKVIIVGLELAPSRGGGLRFVAGYPNFQAITEWNHSNRYAMAVSELAQALVQ